MPSKIPPLVNELTNHRTMRIQTTPSNGIEIISAINVPTLGGLQLSGNLWNYRLFSESRVGVEENDR